LNINYYGVKRVTEALLPLLQLSPAGARIVNVSSLRSELKVKATLPLQNAIRFAAYTRFCSLSIFPFSFLSALSSLFCHCLMLQEK
jgi:hypothetical protein